MRFNCSNCDYEIKTSHLILTKCVCPSCLKQLEVSKISILLFTLILIGPLTVLLSINETITFRVAWSIIWSWFAIAAIKPKLFRFDVVEERVLQYKNNRIHF